MTQNVKISKGDKVVTVGYLYAADDDSVEDILMDGVYKVESVTAIMDGVNTAYRMRMKEGDRQAFSKDDQVCRLVSLTGGKDYLCLTRNVVAANVDALLAFRKMMPKIESVSGGHYREYKLGGPVLG